MILTVQEEKKDIGTVECPSCQAKIIVKRKTVWDKERVTRKKLSDFLYAEAIQTELEE